MIKRILVAFFICTLFFFCSSPNKKINLPQGSWLGMLTLDDKNPNAPIILPFNIEVADSAGVPVFTIINAEERIVAKDITFKGDSVIIQMPVFDSELACVYKDGMLSGKFINRSKKKNNIAKFVAYPGMTERFKTRSKTAVDFSGRWEVMFDLQTDNTYKAIGEFKQNGRLLTGTFLTETGDYRYLQGIADSNNLYLSCFDGSHLFLFTATQKADSSLAGYFYGIGSYEMWEAKRNEHAKLADPDSLTFITDTTQRFNFKFPNLAGKEVSLDDEKYKGKVVMVQIMGSWCPNCMDETQFLSQFYEQHKTKGLEIISLAFERTPDFDKAVKNVTRLKNRFNAHYEFLIAGTNDKKEAIKKLPLLNKIVSYPTTIFIDKKGNVRKIYTGFNGPATGKHYTDFVKETNEFVEKLLNE